MSGLHLPLADTVTFFKGWDLTGNFTTVDLIAASTNALNGALLARRPDHYKNFTIVGILLMALLGLLLAVIGPTAGRWYIDLSSGVTPKQFIRGEWFVSIAALTGLVWILVVWAGASIWVATGAAFVVGYATRVTALWYAWEEPLAREPTGVYQHSDGRPLLGRKLQGKSRRELRDLGLVVDDDGAIVDDEVQPSTPAVS